MNQDGASNVVFARSSCTHEDRPRERLILRIVTTFCTGTCRLTQPLVCDRLEKWLAHERSAELCLECRSGTKLDRDKIEFSSLVDDLRDCQAVALRVCLAKRNGIWSVTNILADINRPDWANPNWTKYEYADDAFAQDTIT